MMIKRNIFAIFTALAATTLLAAGCGGDVECGKGTTEKDGQCVAKAAAEEACGAGTILADGKCVLNESGCGAGTTLVDGACVSSEDACGDGTTLDTATGQCLANSNIQCGSGTVDVDGKCQPAAENCTAGTKLEDGKCVIAPAACGAGTALDANSGICSPAAEACGEGLGFTDGKCVPTEELCDAGTIFNEDTGLCLPEAVCKIGDEIVDGICLSPAAALFNHPDAKSIDGEPTLDMPAEGERLIFTGTIDAPTEVDGELVNNIDKFTFTGEAGQYVKLTLQALESIDLVFEVEGPEGINEVEYLRTSSVGVEVVPARYIYIPYSGEYTVSVQPSFSWFIDLNADGGEGFEFAGTLEQVEAATAADLTLDKETAAEFVGNSRALLNNLYKFDGSADGDLVTFTINDFGADTGSSIFVLSNDTPPAVLGEYNDLGKGDSFRVPGRADGFQILVDNNIVVGQKTNFDISGLINGVIQTDIVDDLETQSITGTVAENTILKISFESDAGNTLNVSVLNDADVQLGKTTPVAAGNVFHMFHSTGGEFTVNLENTSGQAINAITSVEFITPTNIGALTIDSTLDHLVPSHKVGEDIFLLVDTAAGQVLDISLETGVDYAGIQGLLNDILFAEIWKESGNKVFTHSVEDLLIPGADVLTYTDSGQYMALRLSHVPQGFISAGGAEVNNPYNRVGYDIQFNSITPSYLPETGPGYDITGEFEVDTTDDMEEGASDFYLLTVVENVQLSALIEENNGEGDVDMVLYDLDLKQVAFGDTSFDDVVLAAGSYILQVNAYEAIVGGYNMIGSFAEAPNLQTASATNNSFATADLVGDLPALLTGSSRDGANAAHQYWEVSFIADTYVSLTATHVAGDGYMQYRIYDAADEAVALSTSPYTYDGATAAPVTQLFEAGKTYIIRVGGNFPSYDDPYDYKLKLSVVPAPVVFPTEASNNANISEAAAQEITQIPVILTGSVDEADDSAGGINHYWKYTPVADMTVKITATIKNYLVDDSMLNFSLFEDYVDLATLATEVDYIELYPGGDGVTSFSITVSLTAAMDYYFYVGGYSSTYSGEFDYELAIEEI